MFFYSVLLDWTTTHEDDNSILWKFAMLYFWVKRYHLHYLGFKRLSKFLPKYIKKHIFINMFLIYCTNYVFLKVKENDQVTILDSLSIYFFLQSQSWFICIGTIFCQTFILQLFSISSVVICVGQIYKLTRKKWYCRSIVHISSIL